MFAIIIVIIIQDVRARKDHQRVISPAGIAAFERLQNENKARKEVSQINDAGKQHYKAGQYHDHLNYIIPTDKPCCSSDCKCQRCECAKPKDGSQSKCIIDPVTKICKTCFPNGYVMSYRVIVYSVGHSRPVKKKRKFTEAEKKAEAEKFIEALQNVTLDSMMDDDVVSIVKKKYL